MAVSGIFHTTPALAVGGLADLNITETNLALAKRHFETGHEYYKRGEYAAALREFQESYRLSNRPQLLHNIGMCLFQLEDYAKAIEFFDRYLKENPIGEERAGTEEYLARAKQKLPPQKLRKPVRQPPPVAPPPTPIEEELDSENEVQPRLKHPYRLWMWVSLGAAAASLATSGVTFYIANGYQDRHERRVRELIAQGRIVEDRGHLRFADRKAKARHEGELDEMDSRRGLYQNIALGFLIGGAVLAGAGLTFRWLDKKSIKVNPQVGEKVGLQLQVEF